MTTQACAASEPETLRFDDGRTALGTIMVAESARGVVALLIGDDRAKLLRELKNAFPEAELVPDPIGLVLTIAKAAALVEAPQLGTDLTLDLRAKNWIVEDDFRDPLRALLKDRDRAAFRIQRIGQTIR